MYSRLYALGQWPSLHCGLVAHVLDLFLERVPVHGWKHTGVHDSAAAVYYSHRRRRCRRSAPLVVAFVRRRTSSAGSVKNACVLDGCMCGYTSRDTRARVRYVIAAQTPATALPVPVVARTSHGGPHARHAILHYYYYTYAISIIVQKPKARATVYAVGPPATLSGRAARQHRRRPAARASSSVVPGGDIRQLFASRRRAINDTHAHHRKTLLLLYKQNTNILVARVLHYCHYSCCS